MKKIRFAIIGCGRIAQRHAVHIKSRGILAAVCDLEKEKADQLAVEYNARRNNGTMTTSAWDGLKTVSIIEKI